jgi:hypothetical protein
MRSWKAVLVACAIVVQVSSSLTARADDNVQPQNNGDSALESLAARSARLQLEKLHVKELELVTRRLQAEAARLGIVGLVLVQFQIEVRIGLKVACFITLPTQPSRQRAHFCL